MASIDFFGIKEQIVAILKADANLYTTTGATSKTVFRKIEAGAPTPKAMNEPPLPRCWVTNDDLVATAKLQTNVASNAPNGTVYDFRIKIIFVVEAKNGPKTEEDIDDFTKNIIEALQANYDLRDVGGLESTRLADASEVEQISVIPGQVGDAVQGRQIRFRVRATA